MFVRFLCLSLLIMAAMQVVAQGPRPSKFTGSIVGPDSAKVQKAKVLIEGGGNKWDLESDDQGEFRIDLPSGKYQFTIEKPHFKRHRFTDFCVVSGTKISYEFHLEYGECSDCDWIIRDDAEPLVGPERRWAVINFIGAANVE